MLEAASAIFCRGTYRGTTTAEIAKHAGVTEPVLYRHFRSKRDLYLACLEEAWQDTRELWDLAIADEPDPTLWVMAMGRAYLATKDRRGQLAHLWMQSLTEVSDDPEIRKFLRRQLQSVHAYVADVMRRSQEAGGILARARGRRRGLGLHLARPARDGGPAPGRSRGRRLPADHGRPPGMDDGKGPYRVSRRTFVSRSSNPSRR